MNNSKRSFPAWIVEHCSCSPAKDDGSSRLVINYYETQEDLHLSNIIGTVHGLPLYATWRSIFDPEFGHFFNFVSGMDAEYEIMAREEMQWMAEMNDKS